MRRAAGSGDEDADAAFLGAAYEAQQQVRRPMGRDGTQFARNLKPAEHLDGLLHDWEVGATTAHDPDSRNLRLCGHADPPPVNCAARLWPPYESSARRPGPTALEATGRPAAEELRRYRHRWARRPPSLQATIQDDPRRPRAPAWSEVQASPPRACRGRYMTPCCSPCPCRWPRVRTGSP